MAILNYLGFGGPSKASSRATAVRALPASWYVSEEMYQLERRAIFGRRWMMITHKSRFLDNEQLDFDVADWNFTLRWKDELTGFLSDGQSIHVRVDASGFVWVNLASSENPVPWKEDFDGIDVQERYKVYNFDDYVLDNEYRNTGPYNWKILSDNFNECYHCPTAHPTIDSLADIETHDVKADHGWIQHQSTPTEEQQELGMAIASTYFFPNVSISVLPHFIMLQRFLPYGPKNAAMHYQIFRNKNSSEEDFQRIHQLYKQVVSEDKVLCELAQKNLNAGVFINGEMHPRLEKGPLAFQQKQREVIREHFNREKMEERQIWPVRQMSFNCHITYESLEGVPRVKVRVRMGRSSRHLTDWLSLEARFAMVV